MVMAIDTCPRFSRHAHLRTLFERGLNAVMLAVCRHPGVVWYFCFVAFAAQRQVPITLGSWQGRRDYCCPHGLSKHPPPARPLQVCGEGDVHAFRGCGNTMLVMLLCFLLF